MLTKEHIIIRNWIAIFQSHITLHLSLALIRAFPPFTKLGKLHAAPNWHPKCFVPLLSKATRKHIMYFKVLEAAESLVSGRQGLGFLSLPSQQGQEFTWGNAFALGVRPWIAANKRHVFAYLPCAHERDCNKNPFWADAYSWPLELLGAGIGRCQLFAHSLWPTGLAVCCVGVDTTKLNTHTQNCFRWPPLSTQTPWIHLRSELLIL